MIRYPGSKDKITEKITRFFPNSVMEPLWQSKRLEYREPFFGGGAVGFEVLKILPPTASVWINDKDVAMAALWIAVRDQPGELIEMIKGFVPTPDAFYRFKEEDGQTGIDPIRMAFQKLALHQTSFSGLGAMAGGPIGGRKQSSEYNVACRWNATRLSLGVKKRHALFKRFAKVRITSGDFAKLTDNAPSHSFIYLDPPYYEKGGQLYKHNMSDEDHRRLSASLKTCRAPWVLSYDDHKVIRDLYDWADIESVELTYTIATASESRRKNHEIVIRPREESALKVVA